MTYRPAQALSFGIDVNRVTNELTRGGAKASLFGLATYARYQWTVPASVALRYERLDDAGGLFAGIEQVVQEVTVTGEYKLADGFLVRAEFRRDWSDRSFFTERGSDLRRSTQTTALFGLVWWAGGKKGALVTSVPLGRMRLA